MPRAAHRILYLHFAHPAAYPPVAHGAHILAEAGAEVHIIGTRPLVGAAITMEGHSRIRLSLVREGAGFRQKVAFARFALLAIWVTLRLRPTWIYVSDFLAAPVALVVSALSRAAVVYHEHDIPSHANPSWFARSCMTARRKVARSADCVIAPSPGRARHLREALGVRAVQVVMNCPRRRDVRPSRPRAGGSLAMFYHGTIVPQRVPLALGDALKVLEGAATLTLVGYEPLGAAGHVDALVARAGAHGTRALIEYAGIVPAREELLDFCATFDVGLALMPSRGGDANMHTMAGASNKAFDYLACGVPLLVTDMTDWREMFVDAGYACIIPSDEAASMGEALRWLKDNRESLRRMGAAGRERILSEWNYERQFEPVRQMLMQASTPTVTRRQSAA